MAALERSNRALRLLSDSNQSLIRATDEASLLRDICRIAVDVGGYRMAWIGLLEPGTSRLRPRAHHGFEDGFLAAAAPTWDQGEEGSGAAAAALRTAAPSIVRDIPNDPAYGRNRAAAQQRGYRSAAALPLVVDGRVLGVFKVYSAEVDAFGAEEVAVLAELAGDVAYGMTALHTRAERDRIEAALRESNRRLRTAERIARFGHWERDLATDTTVWSDETYRIAGLEAAPPGQVHSLEEYRALIHPDDRARVLQTVAEAIEGRHGYRFEYRLQRADGALRHIETVGEVELDQAGRPRRVLAVNHDVTEQRQAEQRLYLLNRALDNVGEGIYLTEGDSPALRYVNQAAVDTLGRSRAELTGGMTIHDIDPDFGPHRWAELRAATGSHGRLRFESTHRAKDGHRLPVEITVTVFTFEGQTYGLSIARDISERKRAERQLYLLNFALDRIQEGIFLMERDVPRFVYVNQRAVDSLGYSRAELTSGMGVSDIDPAFTPEAAAMLWSELVERRSIALETCHRARDGHTFPVEVSSSVFEFEGRPYCMSVTRDISERQAARSALEAREREFRTLAEHTPDLIVRWDRSHRRVYANPAFASATQADPSAELAGTAFGAGYAAQAAVQMAEALEQVKQWLAEVLESGEIRERELRWTGPAGGRYFHLRLVPERGPDGEVGTVLGVARDITALKETERQLRAVADHSPDVIVRLDPAGRVRFSNLALERLIGVPTEFHQGIQLAADPDSSTLPLQQALMQLLREVCRSGEDREAELTLPIADQQLLFNVRLIGEKDSDGQVASVLLVARDVTERRRAEEALRVSEQRFRQVTETIDEVFWLTDLDRHEFIYVSPAYERLFGRPRQLLYQDPGAWLSQVHPEDRQRLARAIEEQSLGGFDLEYRIEREATGGAPAHGHAYAWIHDRAFPIRDADGHVYRIAGVAEDVTVRRALGEQLRQAQKLEAVGQLAGGIAHDFNNLLAVILMQATMLLDDASGDSDTRDGLREILGAAERAANLTRQLLTFSRREVGQPTDLDISEAIGNMTKLLRRVLGEDVALETRFAPGLPLIHADPGMMEQVLMNLAINGRDAMPEGGRLVVSLDPVEVSEQLAALHPGCAPGRHVCLSVSDTGCGIPARDLQRIFEPFFTTKEVGKGTGLGLATAFGIVQQHHGWIEVESALGAGSTFRVFLPALPRSSEGRAGPAPRPLVRGGHETILLVEDDAAVRSISRSALERYGYRVLEAESALAALRLWDQLGPTPPVDLLLTDLIMPGGFSGRQLADALLDRAPRLRVVYTSGYSPDVVNRLLRLDPGRSLLRKPYAAAELAAAVRRSLDEPASGPS